jgi:hypothetical protein
MSTEGQQTGFINVRIESLNMNAQVHVITMHPDDKAAMKLLYRANNLFECCRKQKLFIFGGESESGEKISPRFDDNVKKTLTSISLLSELESERDAALTELFGVVLAVKHSKEDIDRIVRSCTIGEFMRLFYAAQGVDLQPVGSESYSKSSETEPTNS